MFISLPNQLKLSAGNLYKKKSDFNYQQTLLELYRQRDNPSFLFYVSGCFAYMYVCESHACLLRGQLQEGSIWPELEFEAIMNFHVSAGN